MSLEIDEIVALAMVAITAVLLLVVPPGNLAVFVILVLIGLLVVRALAGPYARGKTNTQVDGFVGVGLAIFALVVLNRVFEILTST